MINSTINLSKKEFEDYEELARKLANIINIKNAGIFFGAYRYDCDVSNCASKGYKPFGYYDEKEIKSKLQDQMAAIIKEFIYED